MNVIEARLMLREVLGQAGVLVLKVNPNYTVCCAEFLDALEVLRDAHERADQAWLNGLSKTLEPMLPLWASICGAVSKDIAKANVKAKG